MDVPLTVSRMPLVACFALALAFSSAATGQETPAASRPRIEQSLKDDREALAALDAPGAHEALPPGITPAEVDGRRRTLEQIVLTSGRSLKNLAVTDETRKELDAALAREKAWSGFKKPPPYSLLMIDDLVNEREAVKSNMTSAESSLANYERMLESIYAEAKANDDATNRALAAVASATPETAPAEKWRLESTHIAGRLLAARAGQFKNMVASQRDRIAAASADLKLLERQIATARANASFTDSDLAKLERASSERKQALGKEQTILAKRLKTALANRDQAKAAADTATEATQDLAKYRLEVAEGSVETVQSLIEGIDGMLQLEDVGMKAYLDRRALADAHSLQDKVKALDALGVPREHLWAWGNVLDDEMAATTADLTKLEARAASAAADDPSTPLLAVQRADAAERLAMLQRLSQAVEAQRRLVKRWVLEHSPEIANTGAWAKLKSATAATRDFAAKIRDMEVAGYENKIVVNGETIAVPVRVTVGMLVKAALLFLLGYWIASHIARRIERTLVARGTLAEPQARTMRNWAMIAIAVILAMASLSVMRIPLTMFAFLGGALAIGVGIGTQNLIKNFVSGIIVLVDRKVRVGDVVEVEGVTGTITEINTRSSVLRSDNDVETLVPNSALLDGKVANRVLSNKRMRHTLRISASYAAPPGTIMAMLVESAGRHGLVLADPPPFAVFEDFGEKLLVFSLFYWVEIRSSTEPLVIASDLRLIIEKRLVEMGCSPLAK